MSEDNIIDTIEIIPIKSTYGYNNKIVVYMKNDKKIILTPSDTAIYIGKVSDNNTQISFGHSIYPYITTRDNKAVLVTSRYNTFTDRIIETEYYFKDIYTVHSIFQIFKSHAPEIVRNTYIKMDIDEPIMIEFRGIKSENILHKQQVSQLHTYSKLPYHSTRLIGEYLGESPLEPVSFRNGKKGGKYTKKYKRIQKRTQKNRKNRK